MATEIETPGAGSRTTVETTAVEAPIVRTRAEPATHSYRAVQAVWLVTSVITTFIAIRFVLKLLGASLESGFVTLIYNLTDSLVSPFQSIFPTASGTTGTIDTAALVAIVVYGLIGLGVAALVKLATAPRGAREIS